MTINKAKQLFYTGSFDKAYDLVNSVLEEESEESKSYCQAKLLSCAFQFYTEKFDECIARLLELIETCRTLEFIDLELRTLLFLINDEKANNVLSKSEDLISSLDMQPDDFVRSIFERLKGRQLQIRGNSNEAIVHHQKSWDLIKDTSHDIEIYRSATALGFFYENIQDYSNAVKFYKICLTISTDNELSFFQADAYYNLGNIDQSRGEWDRATANLDKSLEINLKLGLKGGIARVYNNFGIIALSKGDIDLALEHYKTALEINLEVDNKSRIARSYNNIGHIHNFKGDLDLALEYQFKSLSLNELLTDELSIARNFNNIGLILQQQGDLTESLYYHEKHFEIVNRIGSKADLAASYVNLGMVYKIQGELVKAEEYFTRCLKIDKEVSSEIDIAESMYNLFLVKLNNSIIEAEEILYELSELDRKSGAKIINIRYRIANALFLKKSKRTISRAKSQEILDQLVREEIVDNELTVFAKLNLCELLLFELKNIGEEEVLDELKELVQNLLFYAKEQNTWLLLTEIYLIQSKLALLELDLEEAQKLTNQAQIIADTKGLTNLSVKILNQFDKLNEQQLMIKQLVEKSAPLSEKVEGLKLEDMISEIIEKKPERISEVPDDPAMLLILNNSGISLFLKKFGEGLKFDDNLIGGLLTAIHTLSEDVFATQGSIQRIKHDEFTIMLKPIDDLLFCYVFTGQSYTALKRLNKFIDSLQQSKTIWTALERDLPGLTLSEKDGMGLIITEMF
ncbi:MAG: tetratricopeptide repeat protein [Candidatus Kariarchaeaceae archaeon]